MIVDTTWPINSRTERFKKSLKKSFQIITVAWNRGKKINESLLDYTYLLETPIGYGNQLKKLFMLPIFALHLCKIFYREKPDVIFASHWDSLICSIFIKLMFWNRKVNIIYDCLDMPTFSNKLIWKIVDFLEKKSLKFVELTIFASRYFKPLYPSEIKSLIFENYPSSDFLGSDMSIPDWVEEYDIDLLKGVNNISWIGVVRYFNIIENILLAIKDTNIYFFIFGDGPDVDKVKKLVIDYCLSDRVIFFGRYQQSDLRYIYSLSDLVWAAYPTLDYNAIYAISNKYFECSFFQKRIILSKKTKMAENIDKNSSVILVDEYSPNDIKMNILSNIGIKECQYKKYQKDISWEEKQPELLEYINLILK